jgi:hypothetical protein
MFDFVATNALKFDRWITQAPYSPHGGVMQRIPRLRDNTQLSKAEQYAAVELLRGTIARHSFIVAHQHGTSSREIPFGEDVFMEHVPIRRPDTIMVQERLPQGAAAVLVNRTHTYTDLFLPINARQKRLVEAINGERTVRQLLNDHASPEEARGFFEQLWQMDQIVFYAPSQALACEQQVIPADPG